MSKHTILFLGFLVAVFVSQPALSEQQIEQTCTNGNVTLTKDFEGGRFNQCQVLTGNIFELTLVAEDQPINNSPWYAFKIAADKAQSIQIVLKYPKGTHRYTPKYSNDFSHWSPLLNTQFKVSEDKKRSDIKLDVVSGNSWIAAQPVIDNANYQVWADKLASENKNVTSSIVGSSIEGRPLIAIKSLAINKKPLILLLGRQHPPEVTGAMAMRTFVDTLLANTPIAVAFRREINILILPNLNPDGVAAGNWRHNADGVDLNRDWGPFTQPETRQAINYIEKALENKSLWMTIDFHSTWRDIFYIQKPDMETRFTDLVSQWLKAMQNRSSPIEFEPIAGHSPDKPTSKTYFYQKYKIPAITYELGDETDPNAIEQSSIIAANTFMQLLLTLPQSD